MYQTLISATELASHVADPNWIVLDCRHDLIDPASGRTAFAVGHIPHAQFVHMDESLSGTKIDAEGRFHGRHPLPEREGFIQILRKLGVNADSQVVACDAHGGMYAARLWWMLRWIGHAVVAVLDGGLPAWQAQGGVLVESAADGLAPRPAGSITLREPLAGAVDVDWVLANLAGRAKTVFDARAPDRFRGENETIDPVGGHIPNARNRFFKDNLQADGRFKSPDVLRAEWTALLPDATLGVMQCGSGVTACHNLLALEVAGMPGAALYPGSWSEWCSDPARPVATGGA